MCIYATYVKTIHDYFTAMTLHIILWENKYSYWLHLLMISYYAILVVLCPMAINEVF